MEFVHIDASVNQVSVKRLDIESGAVAPLSSEEGSEIWELIKGRRDLSIFQFRSCGSKLKECLQTKDFADSEV